MLETTATFDKYRIRPNVEAKLLLIIAAETPSRTFYLADKGIMLTGSGEKFEGIVTDWGTIKHTINLFTKKTNVGNVKIKLSNAPYKQNTSGALSISDDLFSSKIINRTAQIYLWFEGITDLADCLKVFEGLVQPIEDATPEHVTIFFVDSTFKQHITIPRNTVNLTDWPDAPPESIDRPLPLHYGAFAMNKDDGAPVDGALAECVWVSPEKIVVSDHVMNSVAAVWIYDEDLGELVKVDPGEYTVTLDDSGRTTIVFNNLLDPLFEVWIYPEMVEIDHVSDPGYILLDKEKRWCHDKDGSSFMELSVDSYTPNGGSPVKVYDDLYARFKNAAPIGTHQAVYLNGRSDNTDMNPTRQDVFSLVFWNDATSSGVGLMSLYGTNKPSYAETNITGLFNIANLTLEDISYPNGLWVNADGWVKEGGGGKYKIGELYDIRLRITYKRSLETNMRVFVEGEGREYGSWIDNVTRSNSYNAGDMIENPAGIIESVLREEIGLLDGDVDEDSFDAALGDLVSWDQVFSIMDFTSTNDLILNVCKQAKMNFFFSSQNKAKVRVIDNSPSVGDDTVVLDDIRRGNIKLNKGQIKSLLNKTKIAYNRWVVDGKFKDVTDAENSTSQDDYNITIEKYMKADKILQDSIADGLRDHYVGSSGFWKDLREILEIDMSSWEHVDWEVGDLIEPQSDFGDVLKNFNNAWGTQLMMIIEKQIKKTGLLYKMIRAN